MVVVPYMLLYSPSVLQIKNKKQALQAVKSEIEAINITLASQTAIPKEPVVEKIVLPGGGRPFRNVSGYKQGGYYCKC